MEEIGNRIKTKRKEKGLTQKELAERIGVDNSQFSKIESGKLYPTLFQVMEISSILEESIDWIVKGKNTNTINDTYIVDLQQKHIQMLELEVERLKSDNVRLAKEVIANKSKNYQVKDNIGNIAAEPHAELTENVTISEGSEDSELVKKTIKALRTSQERPNEK